MATINALEGNISFSKSKPNHSWRNKIKTQHQYHEKSPLCTAQIRTRQHKCFHMFSTLSDTQRYQNPKRLNEEKQTRSLLKANASGD